MVSTFPHRTPVQIRSKLSRMGLKKKIDPKLKDIASPKEIKKQKGKVV